jgi:predicted translin family RNA/ssDNA-binding protein
MFDKNQLNKIKKIHAAVSTSRRQLQGISSDILGCSKRSIFATQRGDKKQAKKELDSAVKFVKHGKTVIKKLKRLENEGMWRAGLEEYAEASMYYDAMLNKKIGKVAELPDESETYIGAISDLTGELSRSCVLAATDRNEKEVKRLAGLVREAVEFLLNLDLTGQLRQKFDQAKQNLRKIEEISFNLSIHGRK